MRAGDERMPGEYRYCWRPALMAFKAAGLSAKESDT